MAYTNKPKAKTKKPVAKPKEAKTRVAKSNVSAVDLQKTLQERKKKMKKLMKDIA